MGCGPLLGFLYSGNLMKRFGTRYLNSLNQLSLYFMFSGSSLLVRIPAVAAAS
jgi:hypothetical protein